DEVARLRGLLEQARSQAKRAAGQSASPPAEAHDLRIQLQRAASDRDAAVKLSRQREQDVKILNSRLNDLLASRWRKLGQRSGGAMGLAGEGTRNGHRNHRGPAAGPRGRGQSSEAAAGTTNPQIARM